MLEQNTVNIFAKPTMGLEPRAFRSRRTEAGLYELELKPTQLYGQIILILLTFAFFFLNGKGDNDACTLIQ